MLELLPEGIKLKIIDFLPIKLKKKKLIYDNFYKNKILIPKPIKYIIDDYTFINKEFYRLISLKKCECCSSGIYINNKCNICGYYLKKHYINHKQKYCNIHNNYLNNKLFLLIQNTNTNMKKYPRIHKKI